LILFFSICKICVNIMDEIDIAIIFMLMETEPGREDTDETESEEVEEMETEETKEIKKTNDIKVTICYFLYRTSDIELYVEKVIPNCNLATFKSHFRLTRQQFQRLLDLIGPKFRNLGSKCPLEKFALMGLWTLATSEPYRAVGDRFNLPKSSVSRYLHDFSNLVSVHGNHLINWPINEEIEETINGFHNLGFPNTLGSIDSCHISINKPFASNVSNPDNYFNRYKFFSVNLMATCNAEMKFTYVDIGSPGKQPDSMVLHLSDLGQIMEQEPHILFPEETHLIGDSAFPLGKYILTPFKDNGHLSRAQKRYNLKLSKARSVIERAFSLLRCRFKRLNHIQMNTVENIVLTIKSCCVLHNLCLDDTSEFCDEYDENENDLFDDDFDGEMETDVFGVLKRNEILSSFVY
ncbi:putative nuclease HARBI1, partial [Armadillidium nasatum]